MMITLGALENTCVQTETAQKFWKGTIWNLGWLGYSCVMLTHPGKCFLGLVGLYSQTQLRIITPGVERMTVKFRSPGLMGCCPQITNYWQRSSHHLPTWLKGVPFLLSKPHSFFLCYLILLSLPPEIPQGEGNKVLFSLSLQPLIHRISSAVVPLLKFSYVRIVSFFILKKSQIKGN